MIFAVSKKNCNFEFSTNVFSTKYFSMKKTLLFLVMAIFSAIPAFAEGPVAVFSKTSHDFGKIQASKGSVTCEYIVTNKGDKPLVIVSVTNGGCGCTKPEFTKQPIQPGAKGTIKVTFNPEGRKGEFKREIKVKTNASSKREALRFSGVIIP